MSSNSVAQWRFRVNDVGETFKLRSHVLTFTRYVDDKIVERDNPYNLPIFLDSYSNEPRR